MKNKNYRDSRLKHQILYERDKGKKVLYWKLTPEQKVFVEEKIGCKVEPYLYEIRTRTFSNISNLPSILKEIHYANKKRKITIILSLNRQEIKVFNAYGIRYRPIKYKLHLTTIKK